MNEDYGSYISNFIYENDIRVQTMNYTYNFEFLKFYTRIIKLWATNKKQSETMLQWASGKWDYFFHNWFLSTNIYIFYYLQKYL